jgi:hypothetical protein
MAEAAAEQKQRRKLGLASLSTFAGKMRVAGKPQTTTLELEVKVLWHRKTSHHVVEIF